MFLLPYYHLPTIRERVFLVSAFNKTAFQFPSPTHTTLDTIKTVQDILEPIEEQYLISQPWILERDFQIKTTKSERVGIYIGHINGLLVDFQEHYQLHNTLDVLDTFAMDRHH